MLIAPPVQDPTTGIAIPAPDPRTTSKHKKFASLNAPQSSSSPRTINVSLAKVHAKPALFRRLIALLASREYSTMDCAKTLVLLDFLPIPQLYPAKNVIQIVRLVMEVQHLNVFHAKQALLKTPFSLMALLA